MLRLTAVFCFVLTAVALHTPQSDDDKPVQDFDMVASGDGAALVESVLEDATNTVAFVDMESGFEAELDRAGEDVDGKPAKHKVVDETPEGAALKKERAVTAKAKAIAAKKAKQDAKVAKNVTKNKAIKKKAAKKAAKKEKKKEKTADKKRLANHIKTAKKAAAARKAKVDKVVHAAGKPAKKVANASLASISNDESKGAPKKKVDETPEGAALKKEREVTAKAKATAAKKAKQDAKVAKNVTKKKAIKKKAAKTAAKKEKNKEKTADKKRLANHIKTAKKAAAARKAKVDKVVHAAGKPAKKVANASLASISNDDALAK